MAAKDRKAPEAEEPHALATLRRIHKHSCGTPNGYLQISRARAALRKLGWKESQLPQYDTKCRNAWRDYAMARRDRGGFLAVKMGPKPEPLDLKPLTDGAKCGTPEGLRRHYRQRRRERDAGKKLTPICDLCLSEQARQRALGTIARARLAKKRTRKKKS